MEHSKNRDQKVPLGVEKHTRRDATAASVTGAYRASDIKRDCKRG